MTCDDAEWFRVSAARVPELQNVKTPTLEVTLIEVWKQVLVDDAKNVVLGKRSYAVLKTPRKGLRQVDFVFDGKSIRGLEQNPDTSSRWAKLAASGKKVMQFLSRGRYIAAVADGKVTLYGGAAHGMR